MDYVIWSYLKTFESKQYNFQDKIHYFLNLLHSKNSNSGLVKIIQYLPSRMALVQSHSKLPTSSNFQRLDCAIAYRYHIF